MKMLKMKNVIKTLVLAGSMAWLTTASAQQVVTVAADSWYPFNGEPGDAKPGYVVEILKSVFEKNGAKVEYTVLPWKRAVADVEQGKIAGVIGAMKSDTPDFTFPEETIGLNDVSFFVKQGSPWKFEGIDSLKGKRLGVCNGYSYNEKLDAYIKANLGAAVDEASGDAPIIQNIKKLNAGRIDTCVEVATVFWANVEKAGLKKEDFVQVGTDGTPNPMYVSFSPKKEESKKLAAQFSEGIKALRSSGDLAKIMEKYGLKDWAK